MNIKTKYDLGQIVQPVINRGMAMLIDRIQFSGELPRYQCSWFVDGTAHQGWFGEFEIEEWTENGNGFKKG